MVENLEEIKIDLFQFIRNKSRMDGEPMCTKTIVYEI